MSKATRQPRVFLSRNTAWLTALAERVAENRALDWKAASDDYPTHHSSFTIHNFFGPLFKGRDKFLAELRQHLTA